MAHQYKSPNGDLINGTAEKVLATAGITAINDDGTPIYDGETEIHWDTQETEIRDGKILYTCESGHEWTFDQLVKVEAADA